MALSLFYTVLLAAVVSVCQVNSCNFPPRFWCDSEEIARQCNVYEQCFNSVWQVSNRHTLRFSSKLFPNKPVEAVPVDLGVYIESLCPDCRRFITTQLFPTFQKVGEIMNITIVPYGNAREQKVGDHWEFTCQHGEEECLGNIIETCAIDIVKNVSQYLPFINCMESKVGDVKEVAKECATKFQIPIDQVFSCTKSPRGNQLEHEMAVMTDKLQPPHQYVPWVTLFGVHTEKIEKEAERNLLKLVCDTYKGPKPSACKGGEQQDTLPRHAGCKRHS